MPNNSLLAAMLRPAQETGFQRSKALLRNCDVPTPLQWRKTIEPRLRFFKLGS